MTRVLRHIRCDHCGITTDWPPWPGWTRTGATDHCDRCSNPRRRRSTPRTARTTQPPQPTATTTAPGDESPPVAGFTYQPQPWIADAICTQTDVELFYPEKGGSSRAAKRICRHCPARPDCLRWALEHHETHGVWGGLSAQERSRLRAAR